MAAAKSDFSHSSRWLFDFSSYLCSRLSKVLNQATKVRISEGKAKEKTKFLLGFSEREYRRPKARGTNKRGKSKGKNEVFPLLFRAKVPSAEGQRLMEVAKHGFADGQRQFFPFFLCRFVFFP